MDVILGTAGHIDHGKTTLVRALTGIDCDRLDEEKRRGITIELGFAWMDLPDGKRLGIVDVPGHERFIKNMVAGASGIDFVLLVIAADEGVMPQTREHLEICSLLGVRSGLVALTKTDLVDSEWLNFVREDIRNSLAKSFLRNAPIVPVSSTTREGLDKLRKEIALHVSSLQTRKKTDILRLPVDRIFSMKGFGTVVTGTVISGACSQGEKICLVPSGKISKIRNLQVHNNPVETAHDGQRCAMNLQGLDVNEIQRGDIVTRPDSLFPSHSWIIRLNCLESSPLPIRQRMELHFHHGSRECLAKIIFRDRELLEPGEFGLAEVKFGSPMAAIYGDHCVLRAGSPLRAIGGGIVISPLPPNLNRRNKNFTENYALLQKLATPDSENPAILANINPEELINICLELCPPPGADINHLKVVTGLEQKELQNSLISLQEKGAAYCWDQANGFWISGKALRECLEKCHLRASELHKLEPLKSYFAPNSLTAGWGEKLPEKFNQEILSLATQKGILIQEGTGLKLATHKIKLDDLNSRILDFLNEDIKKGAHTPPTIKELLEKYGWDIKKIQPLLGFLCDSGQIIKIQEGLYYNKEAFSEIMDTLIKWFENHSELDVKSIKNIFGLSRKYAIPILEYLDSIRFTYRMEDKHILRKNP